MLVTVNIVILLFLILDKKPAKVDLIVVLEKNWGVYEDSFEYCYNNDVIRNALIKTSAHIIFQWKNKQSDN